MRKKKKGSSLIVVVMIFGFLVTFGGGMVAMSASEYKLRVAESRKVHNLYGAESGLEVVRGLLEKTYEAGINYGNIKVEEYKKSLDYLNLINQKNTLENELEALNRDTNATEAQKTDKNNEIKNKQNEIVKKLNEQFRISFIEFTKPGDVNVRYNGATMSDNVVESKKVYNDQIRRALATLSYWNNPNVNEANGSISTEYKKVVFDNQTPEIFYYKDSKLKPDGSVNYDGVQCLKDNNDPAINDSEIDKYLVKVTSEYASTSATGDNRRKVQTVFELEIPNYINSDSSNMNNRTLKKYPVLDGKLMTIDGNLNINTGDATNPVELKGNVHVTGNPSTAGEYKDSIVYKKYKGGISINNSKVNFESGDVTTGETFNVGDNSYVNINDIYARNIFVGNKKGTQAYKATINIRNSIYTDNDLMLNAKDSTVNMKNFYGLNDKNIKDTNETSSDVNSKTSSSIIVNGNENSSVNVTNSAIIMGVGYMDDGHNGYKTGESTAVKGNYIAYADPTLFPNVSLKDYGSMHLLDNEALNVFEKSEVFKKYWESQSVNNGGISLPKNTTAVGAFFYKDKDGNLKLSSGNSTIDNNDKLKAKKNNYAKKVYNLGQADDNNYENGESNKWTVSSEVNFGISPTGYKIEDQNNKRYKFIYNNSGKKIVIKGKELRDPAENDVIVNDDEIQISGKAVNAVIVTNGDVQIEGSVNFSGNIIAKGSINISSIGKKSFIQNTNVTNIIAVENYEAFTSGIFKDENSQGESIINAVESGNDASDISAYNVSERIKSRSWKLII